MWLFANQNQNILQLPEASENFAYRLLCTPCLSSWPGDFFCFLLCYDELEHHPEPPPSSAIITRPPPDFSAQISDRRNKTGYLEMTRLCSARVFKTICQVPLSGVTAHRLFNSCNSRFVAIAAHRFDTSLSLQLSYYIHSQESARGPKNLQCIRARMPTRRRRYSVLRVNL